MKEEIKELFLNHMQTSVAKKLEKATPFDCHQALALSVRDLLVKKWINTQDFYDETTPKMVYYLSLEFLMGRALGNAMINLEVYQAAKEALGELDINIDEIREEGVDAGLGNGGLGRLAACFLDSLATLDLPATGYGIRYDYGIFKQEIIDGYQVEEPDNWLRHGNPWEINRPECARVVKFYGHTEQCRNSSRGYKKQWVDTEDVLAMPYDTPIPGYKTETVNTLRLWSAKSLFEFNLDKFNQGDYVNANINASLTENITKILYPNDNNYEGKELRLKQQYFLVSATLQDILAKYKANGGVIEDFNSKAAIQLNDTHPALAIPELMRILLDDENLSWEKAWDICTKTFSYTNHTLMVEALEKWSTQLLERLLPRILEVIYEINSRFMRQVSNKYPGDMGKLNRLSIVEEGDDKKIRMAYMAIVGSSKVNGVAALHTELLKKGLFNEFYQYSEDKFINVTNGITPRRWLKKANPELADAITDKIGDDWVKHLDKLEDLEKFTGDKKFLKALMEIKKANKEILAQYILENNGIEVNPDSIFDVQVKRLHEYKRQLLNILHAVALYLDIKDNPKGKFVPRTVIFGAKAAPGYYMAKSIIKLINSVATVINNDPDVGDKLKVVFLKNYRVSLAEKIIPATDLSEQISLAGTEASGTGNMKFMINGALTIGTLDGANVEINEAVGDDNIFIFGMKVEEAQELMGNGYNPNDFVNNSPRLKRVLELVRCGFFSPEDENLFAPLLDSLNYDTYMLAADFDAYYDAQKDVEALFKKKQEWAKKALINIANGGRFSSDRTINEYANNIWNIKPVSQK